jgi:hypothetical protein
VGWEALVDDPQLGRTSWRPCRITLVPRGEGDRELAQAALAVFAERANACFYACDEEFGRDPRKRWTVAGGEAVGSANGVVIWAMHRLCARELSLVARRGALERVVLAVEGDSFYVSQFSTPTD